MGHKNAKMMGPAKRMAEKHGKMALEGLKHWQKQGFPKMGSFCLLGHFNLSLAQITDADLDLDFPRNANAPPLSSFQPPTYAPAAAAAAHNQHTDRGETKPTPEGTTCSQTLTQRSTRLAQTTTYQPGPQGNTSVKDGDDGLFPMIQVLNPQDGNPAVVFRAWKPSDIKDMAECLPDPSVAGGAALATAIAEMVQQHKPAIAEVSQVCVSRFGLRWGRIQGDMPARDQPDIMYDWAAGAQYRLLVEGLCGRAREAFPLVRDWTAVRDIKQWKGEKVNDLLDRLEKVFQIHGGMVAPPDRRDQTPYEDAITHTLLDALDEHLSEFVKRHCIGWRTARLAVIVNHASHADDIREKQREKNTQKREMMCTKLQLAQLGALTDSAPNPHYLRQGYENTKGRGEGRGDSSGWGPPRGSRELGNSEGCFRCGEIDHRVKDCKKRDIRYENEERYDEGSGWRHAPHPVTVNYQRKGGGRRHSH